MRNINTNRLKGLLREDDRVLFGTRTQEVREGGTVHVMARSGADFVFIDMEHSPISYETVADLVAHAHAAGTTPMVRISDLTYESVTRTLDLGCQTLFVPHLKTPEQVQTLLSLARYYPLGVRGMNMSGNVGVNYYPVPDVPRMQQELNENLLLGLNIETKEAVDAAEDMLVDGIGFAMVGPSDLSQSYGVPGEHNHPRIEEAKVRVRKLCKERDIAYFAGASSPSQFGSIIQDGARLVMYAGVLNYVRDGVTEAVRRLRELEESGK